MPKIMKIWYYSLRDSFMKCNTRKLMYFNPTTIRNVIQENSCTLILQKIRPILLRERSHSFSKTTLQSVRRHVEKKLRPYPQRIKATVSANSEYLELRMATVVRRYERYLNLLPECLYLR